MIAMTEIFQEALKGYNLPLTILVGLIGLYWVISLFGFIDFESIDHAVGLDDVSGGHDEVAGIDADGQELLVEADSDAPDHHHLHDHSPNAFQATLRFLGANDAPIMFVLTLFSLYTWGGNMLANFYFNAADSTTLANIMLLGVIIGALILTKLTVRPLRPLMKMMRSASSPGNKPITGKGGTVRSTQITNEYGQVEVFVEGASILLNARLSDGCDALPRGSEVLVVGRDTDGKRDLHIVRPLAPPLNQDDPDTSPNETAINE